MLGAVLVAAVLILVVDLALAQDRVLPAAEVVGVVGWLGIATVAAGILTAARHWDPDTGWLVALRLCWPTWRADPAGLLYLLSAVGLVGILAWQLLPLVVPGIGCLLLAVLAIPERRVTD